MIGLAELRRCYSYNKRTGILTRTYSQYRPDTVGRAVGELTRYGYLQMKIEGRNYLVHRVIWFLVTGKWPVELDHRNGIRSDNRWSNLRDSTRAKNRANSGLAKNNKLGVKGVRLTVKGRYEPRLRVNGKALWLGTYKTVEEAAAVYAKAAREHFGEFARTK